MEARTRPPNAQSTLIAIAVLTAVATGFALDLALARFPAEALNESVAVGSLCALAGIVWWTRRTGRLASPVVILAAPLLLGLAAAMRPITQIYSAWAPSEIAVAVGVAVAPLVGIALAAMVATRRNVTSRKGRQLAPLRLVMVVTGLFVLGASVLIYEFAGVGGPPLLSGRIDEARFSLIQDGPLHLLTEAAPLSALVATWARTAHPEQFNRLQRRWLEGIVALVFVFAALQGGRLTVFLPFIACVVIALRFIETQHARRVGVLLFLVFISASAVYFVARAGQGASVTVSSRVFYDDQGATKSPPVQALDGLTYSLGEQTRVVQELREAQVNREAPSTTLWFAHRFVARAQNPEDVAEQVTRFWVTSGYVGPVLLDFGLVPGLLAGVIMGFIAERMYRRYRTGDDILSIWLYAFIISVLSLAFYANLFLLYAFVWIDVAALVLLSRVVTAPANRTQ
jgi:hypothetical protein